MLFTSVLRNPQILYHSLNPSKFSARTSTTFSTLSSCRFKYLPLRFNHSYSISNSAEAARPMVPVKDQIDLTVKESQIFDRLIQVVRHFNLKTELRVAGGWVRDKLLGKECYDIDIALDDMLGKDFCEKVNEYLLSTGEETQGIGVIQCNPDQSKHLETARMRLLDEWIDFVNLRAEDYSENSRIPTMRFGTAKEDAYRRDLTINSLFYNINKGSVEDFTERGLSHLKAGKIVTPLPPKNTFLDDPLRVLRAIRFGARFDFVLDDELKIAAADDDVKAALADKISRERIGHEIDLMISGNNPVKAMTYVSELQLFSPVFSLPLDMEPPALEGHERLCVTYMDSAWNLLHLIGCPSFTDDQQRLCLYAALLVPFRNTVYKDKKGKKIPVASHIFRTSLKLKASDAETVISLHAAAEKFVSSILPSVVPYKDLEIPESDSIVIPVASELRKLAGLLLREIKEFWRPALVVSLLLYPHDIGSNGKLSDGRVLTERKGLYNRVVNAILETGLEKVWELKPLMNGREIMSFLELKSGGPLVKEWQQKILEWQLENPTGTAEQCHNWMKESQNKRARTE